MFRGAGLVTNLSRCNIYTSLFNWRFLSTTTDLLYYGNVPILSFIVGFAEGSNLTKPTLLRTKQLVKDVTLHPFGHEFERLAAAIAHLADDDRPRLRCFDNGLKIQTGQKPPNWAVSGEFITFLP